MKFSLFIHMERVSPDEAEKDLYDQMIELCQIADAGGMHAIWTGEHHGMNFTIAPNPLLNLVESGEVEQANHLLKDLAERKRLPKWRAAMSDMLKSLSNVMMEVENERRYEEHRRKAEIKGTDAD